MTAAILNIEIEQGATYLRTLTLKDDQAIPQPINITGYVFRGAIKLTPGAATLAEFSFVANDPTNGKIDMVLTAEQSALLPTTGSSFAAESYFQYDVEMVDTNQTVFRLLNGRASVSPEITT